VWTFGAADAQGGFDVAYHFEDNRSGATPKAPLEGTKGVLLVDGYSGYNDIEKVSSRRRAACFAHVRRYFFESLKTAPIAQEALDLITELYRVEHDAKEKRLSETSHLEFRKLRSGPIRERLKAWLDAQRTRHPPKSPLGVAIGYTLGQWAELGVFLDDARVPLDNNASERSLRRIALGRKNYLFVRRRRFGQEPHRALLAGRHLRIARHQSLRLPRRCPRPRAGSPGPRDRRAAAEGLGRGGLSKASPRRHDGVGRTVTAFRSTTKSTTWE